MAIINGKIILSHSETLGEQLESIAECLRDYRTTTLGGRTARDIGLLCTSPNINKWSKNRPFETRESSEFQGVVFNHNIYGIQSDWDRKNSAYGFYWDLDKDNKELIPIDDGLWTLLDRAKSASGGWTQKPLSIYRVWDFDGYDHNAKNPYVYNIEGHETEQERQVTAYRRDGENYIGSLSLSDMPNPYFMENIEASWLDWPLVAVAMYEGEKLTDSLLATSNTGLTIRDLDESPDVISTKFNLPFNGTDKTREYDVMWTVKDPNTNYWVYLPYSLGILKHKASYTVKWNRGAGFVFDAVTDADLVISKISLKLKLNNFLPYPIFFNCRLDIWEKGDKITNGRQYNFLSGVESSDMYFELSFLNESLSFTPKLDNTMLALTFNPRNGETFEDISPITHFNPKDDCVEEGEAKTEDGYTIQDFRLFTLLQ